MTKKNQKQSMSGMEEASDGREALSTVIIRDKDGRLVHVGEALQCPGVIVGPEISIPETTKMPPGIDRRTLGATDPSHANGNGPVTPRGFVKKT